MASDGRKALRGGLGVLAAALVLVGCGGGSSGSPAISFVSPGVEADGVIQPSIECGLGSLWLPLKWGEVPSDTKELAIYIGRFKYKKVGQDRKLVVPFGNLVSHISPSRRHIQPNVFPPEAGWSTIGPVSCPPVRKGQNIVLALFALDRTRTERELKMPLAEKITAEALSDRKTSATPKSQEGGAMQDAVGAGHIIATYGP